MANSWRWSLAQARATFECPNGKQWHVTPTSQFDGWRWNFRHSDWLLVPGMLSVFLL